MTVYVERGYDWQKALWSDDSIRTINRFFDLKDGSSLFLVGSACQLLLGCEVQMAQPEQDHRPEVGDAPEAPGDAAGGLDDGVEAFQERVGRSPLSPVKDPFPLLPERPRHALHLGHGRVHHPRAEALWGLCRRFPVCA